MIEDTTQREETHRDHKDSQIDYTRPIEPMTIGPDGVVYREVKTADFDKRYWRR